MGVVEWSKVSAAEPEPRGIARVVELLQLELQTRLNRIEEAIAILKALSEAPAYDVWATKPWEGLPERSSIGNDSRESSSVAERRLAKPDTRVQAPSLAPAPGTAKAKILLVFDDGREHTAPDLAAATGVPAGSINTHLKELLAKGLIVRTRRGVWCSALTRARLDPIRPLMLRTPVKIEPTTPDEDVLRAREGLSDAMPIAGPVSGARAYGTPVVPAGEQSMRYRIIKALASGQRSSLHEICKAIGEASPPTRQVTVRVVLQRLVAENVVQLEDGLYWAQVPPVIPPKTVELPETTPVTLTRGKKHSKDEEQLDIVPITDPELMALRAARPRAQCPLCHPYRLGEAIGWRHAGDTRRLVYRCGECRATFYATEPGPPPL